MHATEESVSIPSYTPKQLSGALDRFESFQVTPCIGTEFRNVNLAELITSADSDAVLKDLAITGMTLLTANDGSLVLANYVD